MIYDCALPIASLDLIYCIYILFDKFLYLKKIKLVDLFFLELRRIVNVLFLFCL